MSSRVSAMAYPRSFEVQSRFESQVERFESANETRGYVGGPAWSDPLFILAGSGSTQLCPLITSPALAVLGPASKFYLEYSSYLSAHEIMQLCNNVGRIIPSVQAGPTAPARFVPAKLRAPS